MTARSGLVQENQYSYKSPDPIFPYGESLESFGLFNRSAVDGFGLTTRGLLWEMYNIWIDTQYFANITTSWAAAAGSSIATTWAAAAGASVSTTWSDVRFAYWGEANPG